jgi:AraC family transcriptional regulator
VNTGRAGPVYDRDVGLPAASDAAEPRTRHLLLRSLGVSVLDFRCRAHAGPPGPEEPNETHGIVFVRKGVFRRTVGGQTLVADANHVLFFNAGEPYRYDHPLPGGDECTILVVDAYRALDLVAHHAPRDAERPERPFRHGHGLSSPRAVRLQYELLGLARNASPLALEDAVVELADEAVGAAYRIAAAPRRRPSGSAPAHRDLVEAAKVAVNGRIESPPSLSELARTLGCSPFHLSRTFHRTAGLSLRSYLGRLRTRLAADRLAAGARDLTDLALHLGYADHSHFTNAFRREWGLPPSAFRALQHRERKPSGRPAPA